MAIVGGINRKEDMRLRWWRPKPISAIRAQIVRRARRKETYEEYSERLLKYAKHPESLRKAREQESSKTLKRNYPKEEK